MFIIGNHCYRGGDEENRTLDPLLARQVLSQLSYTPILGNQALENRDKSVTRNHFNLAICLCTKCLLLF